MNRVREGLSPKEECEQLMGQVLMPFAKKMLEEHQEFLPFGGSILADGTLTSVGSYTGEESPHSNQVIEFLLGAFRAQAKQKQIRASGIAFDVRVVPPGESEKTDAIAVRLDHAGGFSVIVFHPYRISEGHEVLFSAPFAHKGAGDVFDGPPAH